MLQYSTRIGNDLAWSGKERFHRPQTASALQSTFSGTAAKATVSGSDSATELLADLVTSSSRSVTPHKRSRLDGDLGRDHTPKRSRHSPPVEGLPAPIFDTIPSGNQPNPSAGWIRPTDTVTVPQPPSMSYFPATANMGYDPTTQQQNLSGLLDVFLADSTHGRPPLGYDPLAMPAGPTIQPDPVVLQHQQPAFRKALYDNSFLYEF